MKKTTILYKIIFIFLTICFVLGGNEIAVIAASTYDAIEEIVKEETSVADDYFVTDFSSISENDWQVNEKSDTARTKVSLNNNKELVIKAESGSSALYYGGLFHINPGAIYKDFTFEMEFKITPESWQNLDRWIAIIYHMNYESGASQANDEGADVGYIMQYRVSGRNCYSAVNQNRAYKDDNEITANGPLMLGDIAPALSDGKSHKITITMLGNLAKHYMDGFLIREALTSTKDAHLGKTYSSGGFALMVNALELSIKSCKITSLVDETIGVDKYKNYDNTIASTYQNPNVKIVNAPTVVCDVANAEVLHSLSGNKKPSNAILRFNKDANIVDINGNIFDSFTNIYKELNHQIIPVVFVADEASANALIDYLNNTLNILDLAVMSDNPALVKKVRTACPRIRGIVSYVGQYSNQSLSKLVGNTNANLASIAVISQKLATAENVRYIQARFKTVWVVANSVKSADLYECVNSGAYGVIASDFEAVYDVLESYSENSYTRMLYNVAHRGSFAALSSPASYPTENSIGAINEAIALGASHFELDAYLTKDGHVVIMHDITIDRTSTGTGNINNMTLNQIQQYKLKDGQSIPTLEEIFIILEQHKDIVLLLELKNPNGGIVEAINNLIGTGKGQYDVGDQLLIVSFNNNGYDVLADVKNIMPAIPSSYIMSGNSSGTMVPDLARIGYYNCGMHIKFESDLQTPSYNKECLIDRGIQNWYWGEFTNLDRIIEQVEFGHMGATNNAVGVLMNMFNRIEGIEGQRIINLHVGDMVEATAYTYSGEARTVKAKVFFVEKVENNWNTIVSYTFISENGNYMTLYSPLFTIMNKNDSTENDLNKSKLDASMLIAILCITVAAALAIGVVIFLIKKKYK